MSSAQCHLSLLDKVQWRSKCLINGARRRMQQPQQQPANGVTAAAAATAVNKCLSECVRGVGGRPDRVQTSFLSLMLPTTQLLQQFSISNCNLRDQA